MAEVISTKRSPFARILAWLSSTSAATPPRRRLASALTASSSETLRLLFTRTVSARACARVARRISAADLGGWLPGSNPAIAESTSWCGSCRISSIKRCFSSKAVATSRSFLRSRSIGVTTGCARYTDSPPLTVTLSGLTSSRLGSVRCKTSTFWSFLFEGRVAEESLEEREFQGRLGVLLLVFVLPVPSSSDPA